MLISGANRHGSVFKKSIDTLPVVKELQGKLRGRPSLPADEGYHYTRYSTYVKKQGMPVLLSSGRSAVLAFPAPKM